MKKGDSVFKIVISAAIFISFAVIGFYFYQFAREPLSADNGTWGEFGDYIGGTLNPVFGFLSLIVLLLVYIQNKEEMKDTKRVLAEQSETMKIQRFEQTFFALLKLYNEVISLLQITKLDSTEKLSGSSVFREIYIRLSKGLGNGDFAKEINERASTKNTSKYYNPSYAKHQEFNEKYKQFSVIFENTINHYFRIVFNILKFIHTSNLENKQLYINLLRAQMSKYELLLLFYNCLSESGKEKMLPMAIEYDIFQHISKDFLFNSSLDLKIFEDLKQELELAQTAKERLAENETPIRVSIDSL